MKKILSLCALFLFAQTTFAQVTTNNGNTSTGGGGGSYTSDNGITLTGSNFQLGGSLSKSTFISGLYGFTIGAVPSLRIYADTLYAEIGSYKFLHHYHKPSVSSGNGTYPNLFTGFKSGQSLASSGYANTSYGCGSSYALNGDSSNASSNTVDGYNAMNEARYALRNTISGAAAMSLSGTGSAGSPITGNVLIGHHAGKTVSGNFNSALGTSALENAGSNTSETVAVGYYSGRANNATQNTLVGSYTAWLNTTSNKLTAVGFGAMQNLPAATAAATENTAVGALAMGVAPIAGGYNTAVGAGALKNLTTGNTNTSVGRESGAGITTAVSSITIGNNAQTTGNFSNVVVVSRNGSVTGDNQLLIGGALYGANIYTPTPRFALGKAAGAGSTFDMGGCTFPIILPKSSTASATALETGMLYYNSVNNDVEMYNGSSWGVIQKFQPISETTSASGVVWSSASFKVILNATSNAITQAIPPAVSTYTSWNVEFTAINAAINKVTFSFPANTYVNGVIATSYVCNNGDKVRVECDGSKYIVTVIKPTGFAGSANYNGLNPVLGTERVAYFDASAFGTITLPTVSDGRTITLVNDAALALTLGTAVKTGQLTTTTTLPIDTRMTISYDASISQWRLIGN